jgi:hypothetical protein
MRAAVLLAISRGLLGAWFVGARLAMDVELAGWPVPAPLDRAVRLLGVAAVAAYRAADSSPR